ncbi:MAG TPA: Uma2 family endonuclease [Thermoanaerobaculia bacterium]|nr:Uma2 family endonuclease [Thermoanaerobaculia bacterium]
MAARVREHATYEDLLQVPENLVAELIDGELVTSPRPAGPHTFASSAIGVFVGGPFGFGRGGPGGWWILDEPELHFRQNVLVPDLAGWRRERMPEIPKHHMFSVVPDWVCEIVSPSSGRRDRMEKMPIYGRADVGHLWLLDPEQQTLEVYENSAQGWRRLDVPIDPPVVRVPPFDAIEMDLTLIWGPSPA